MQLASKCPGCKKPITLDEYQVRALHSGNLMERDTLCGDCMDTEGLCRLHGWFVGSCVLCDREGC